MDTSITKLATSDSEHSLGHRVDNMHINNDDSSDTSSATEKEDFVEPSGREDTVEDEPKEEKDGDAIPHVKEYVVEDRDTLNSIAAKNNTTPSL